MIDSSAISQLLPLLQQNPSNIAAQYGLNVPQNQQYNGPRGITEYLLNSGQIDQSVLNQAINTARQMGYRV